MAKFWLKELAFAALVGIAIAGPATVGPAGAADMMPKPQPMAPINWTGCYIGGTVGWGLGNHWHSTDLNNYNPGSISPWEFSLNPGALFGGTAGCNWEVNRSFVVGVEGEGGALSLSQNLPAFQPPGFASVNDAAKIGDGYGAITARFGVLFFDQIYWYGKIGVAFFSETATITDVTNPFLHAAASKSQSPLAAGSGVEYAFNNRWSGKAEWMFFDAGTSFNACGVNAGRTVCWKQDPTQVETFKFGLNYKLW